MHLRKTLYHLFSIFVKNISTASNSEEAVRQTEIVDILQNTWPRCLKMVIMKVKEKNPEPSFRLKKKKKKNHTFFYLE